MRGYVEWMESEARERPEGWEPSAEDFTEAMLEKADAVEE
jgi:hypothetical protein